jgi:hypothetical protein
VDPYNCAAVYVCALGSILAYNTCDPGLIFNETLGACVPGKCPPVTTCNETSQLHKYINTFLSINLVDGRQRVYCYVADHHFRVGLVLSSS